MRSRTMTRVNIIIQDVANFWTKMLCVVVIIFIGFQVLLASFLDHPIIYTLFLVLSVATITAREFVTIDLAKGVITEGYWILGTKSVDITHFSAIEKIFINRVRLSTRQDTYSQVDTVYSEWDVYKAFLKTVEGDKIVIGIGSNKKELIRRIIEHNRILRTPIVDTSDPHNPVMITREY
jgi:hypothetical protein